MMVERWQKDSDSDGRPSWCLFPTIPLRTRVTRTWDRGIYSLLSSPHLSSYLSKISGLIHRIRLHSISRHCISFELAPTDLAPLSLTLFRLWLNLNPSSMDTHAVAPLHYLKSSSATHCIRFSYLADYDVLGLVRIPIVSIHRASCSRCQQECFYRRPHFVRILMCSFSREARR
ncbi:hypothetical protein BC827DRAFT_1194931 [Russula dissimulans]|jgi:hypothetical protein|nr:hypothetical protein BC827DRAFT_1194931 [Russula dissimulans]